MSGCLGSPVYVRVYALSMEPSPEQTSSLKCMEFRISDAHLILSYAALLSSNTIIIFGCYSRIFHGWPKWQTFMSCSGDRKFNHSFRIGVFFLSQDSFIYFYVVLRNEHTGHVRHYHWVVSESIFHHFYFRGVGLGGKEETDSEERLHSTVSPHMELPWCYPWCFYVVPGFETRTSHTSGHVLYWVSCIPVLCIYFVKEETHWPSRVLYTLRGGIRGLMLASPASTTEPLPSPSRG